MTQQWIDFRKLKQELDFRKVLEHYRVTVKVKGEQATGPCPLPTHDGERKSSSFSAQLEKGIWQCFGCKAKGNVLDFAVRMEGFSPDDRQSVRTVALKLSDLFFSSTDEIESTFAPSPGNSPTRMGNGSETETSVLVNQPLDFRLKGLDGKHRYLKDRGLSPQTISRFDLGFCSRGTFRGRIVIPIHDEENQLIGYAGRLVDESQVSKTNPKYKFPPARERNGAILEFHKSRLLYNANRILAPAMNLIVVEGFASVWWLYQWGFHDVVALMGSDCSPEQAEIIVSKVSPDGRVLALPDGDESGNRCAVSLFETIASERDVRWVRLLDDRQPTDCSSEELFRMLTGV